MRTKNIIPALTALALLLAGCAGAEGSRSPGPPEDISVPAGDVEHAPTGGAQYGAEPIGDADTARGALEVLGPYTGAGYYYLTSATVDLTGGGEGRRLMYIDYASRREVYLCGDPACSHESADCTSVFPTDEIEYFSRVFTMGKRVYLLSAGADMDGSVAMGLAASPEAAEGVTPKLYAMEAGGAGREVIYTFEAGLTVEDFAAGDGEGIYFITKRVSTESDGGSTYFTATDRELARLDLSTGELSKVCGLDFGGGVEWSPVGTWGREHILSGIDFGESGKTSDGRADYESAADVFAALDVDTGELREFYRVEHPKSRGWALEGGTLYYAAEGSGEIMAVSVSEGAARVLCETPHDELWGTVGGRLYGLDGEGVYHFIDPATGEESSCALRDRTTGFHIQIVAEAGDMALVIYDTDAQARGDGSFTVNGYYYALMTLQDLWAGVENYEPIEMQEAGV